MRKIPKHAFQLVLVLFWAPCTALAVNPAHWMIVEQLTRGQSTTTWVSPTPVDLGKMVWEYDFEIIKVTGTVNVPILGDVTEDITSSIPAEDRTPSGETRDLPAVLLDDMLVEPETGTSADVLVEIDNLGFGRAVFSNIVLGSVAVPLFGTRPIQRINIEAQVDIVGYDFGDYNRDGTVDAADYVVWRLASDSTSPNLAADGNGNEQIDDGDYDVWRAHFGRGAGGRSELGSFVGSAVPEPATCVMLVAAMLCMCFRRRTTI